MDFEDHCWQDVIPPETAALYKDHQRETFVGQYPALLAIDLFNCAYRGGAVPVEEATKEHPLSCGIYAWNALAPTRRLFAAARTARIPIILTTFDTWPNRKPESLRTTKRRRSGNEVDAYRLRAEFEPQLGDILVTKQRASAFFGTPLTAYLTQLGVKTLIIMGTSTSGCVRASTVDGFSYGYHVVLAEECCFDRNQISHKINLFDMHHKYADVMSVEAIIQHLDRAARRPERAIA